MTEASDSEFVKIILLESLIESQLVSSILTERQVPHRLRSYHDTAYDGLFQATKGWGAVYAPETYHEMICDIVSEIRASHDQQPIPDA